MELARSLRDGGIVWLVSYLQVCKNYTRAYLHHLVTNEPSAAVLVTYHNIRHMMNLSRNLHNSIKDGTFPVFVNNFLKRQYPKGNIPNWVREALVVAELPLDM